MLPKREDKIFRGDFGILPNNFSPVGKTRKRAFAAQIWTLRYLLISLFGFLKTTGGKEVRLKTGG